MGWDDIKMSISGEFVKIAAGKSVRVHLLGAEPETKIQHFIDKKPLKCEGAACIPCKQGVRRDTKFSISVFNLTEKRQQFLEAGKSIFQQILTTRELLGGDLDGVDFVIAREGSGQNDTKYTVVNVPTQFRPEMLVDSTPS